LVHFLEFLSEILGDRESTTFYVIMVSKAELTLISFTFIVLFKKRFNNNMLIHLSFSGFNQVSTLKNPVNLQSIFASTVNYSDFMQNFFYF